MSDSEWKREMKEIRGQMYWKPGPWIKEKLDVAKWQLLLWRDFKVYIHKTRKKKNATKPEISAATAVSLSCATSSVNALYPMRYLNIMWKCSPLTWERRLPALRMSILSTPFLAPLRTSLRLRNSIQGTESAVLSSPLRRITFRHQHLLQFAFSRLHKLLVATPPRRTRPRHSPPRTLSRHQSSAGRAIR